jgi:hypothetical protein
MSDENVPTPEQPEAPQGAESVDSTPTEALELADQQPIADQPAPPPVATPAATTAAAAPNHTRTILEIVGGVVAAGLIVVAGAAGFAVGHATSDSDRGWRLDGSAQPWPEGPDAGGRFGEGDGRGAGPGGGQGFGPGRGDRGGQQPGQQFPGNGPQMPGYGDHHMDGSDESLHGGRGQGPEGEMGLGDGFGPMSEPSPSATATG